MYMYVGIRRIHELIPDQAASLGHNPTVKHETTRVVNPISATLPFVSIPMHRTSTSRIGGRYTEE